MRHNLERPIDYQLLLTEELAARKRKNPAYSLNAFSKSLGVSAPSLSQIISGKRAIGKKTVKKILSRLLLTAEKRHLFLESALNMKSAVDDDEKYDQLSVEMFKAISEWYHYAILSLGEIRSNKAEPKWIAKQLDISLTEARTAFRRLIKLGLIKVEKGSFRQSSAPLCLPGSVSEEALRSHLHQNIRKAQAALENTSVSLEQFSNITMAIDESKLPEARKMIRSFRRKLCKFIETGNPKRIYTLNIQFFPVSKGG